MLKLGGKRYHDLVLIALEWRDVVGSLIADHARVVKYVNNSLYIGVDSSVWLQELVLMKNDILNKLNKKLARKLGQPIAGIYFMLNEKK